MCHNKLFHRAEDLLIIVGVECDFFCVLADFNQHKKNSDNLSQMTTEDICLCFSKNKTNWVLLTGCVKGHVNWH